MLVIPGFLATDSTTMALRKALAAAGWRVHAWGMGLNTGRQGRHAPQAREPRSTRSAPRQPILVVGWSLGGLYARELARHAPTKVRAVVTLGSPFSGDLHQNNVWRLYEWVAGHRVDDAPVPRDHREAARAASCYLVAQGRDRLRRALPAAWKAERDEAVELDCSHMAFAVSRRAAERGGARNRQIPEKAHLISRNLLFR